MVKLRLFMRNRIFLLLLLINTVRCLLFIVRAEDDTACLRSFKKSVHDPKNYLANWIFTNESEESSSKGNICFFAGVECWEDAKVTYLKLPQAGLSGSFPSGLNNCLFLTELDLSNNQFSGPIPSDICQQMRYLTSLNLSQNRFSGPIPDNLGSCSYLNELDLQQNQLSGTIPWSIGVLPRLTNLNLSSNLLSGPIPSSFTNRTAVNRQPFPPSSFQSDPGLCGPPLSSSCRTQSDPHTQLYRLLVIVGAAVATAAILLQFLVWWRFCTFLHGKWSNSQQRTSTQT